MCLLTSQGLPVILSDRFFLQIDAQADPSLRFVYIYFDFIMSWVK